MADIEQETPSVEMILDHEEKITMGKPVVFYNAKKVEYIDKQGRRSALWLVIYEVDDNRLGVTKRWVLFDQGTWQWTGGIIG